MNGPAVEKINPSHALIENVNHLIGIDQGELNNEQETHTRTVESFR